MKESSYAVLGMGRYGQKLAMTLARTGAEILIADQDRDIINTYADMVTHAVSLDLANTAALKNIGLEHIDVVVVDLANHLEASIMCIMVAREHDVRTIIATANSSREEEIFLRVGADEVVIPEDETAVRTAKRLISEDFMEYFDIGGGLCIVKAPPKKEWLHKSLQTLQLPSREHIRIVALERDGKMDMDFASDIVLEEDMALAMVVPKNEIFNLI